MKDTLQELSVDIPHTMQAVDITDDGHSDWWDRYKYDIPVLHLNDQYWTKHRLDADSAKVALQAAIDGSSATRADNATASTSGRTRRGR